MINGKEHNLVKYDEIFTLVLRWTLISIFLKIVAHCQCPSFRHNGNGGRWKKRSKLFFFLDCDVSIIGNGTVKLLIITAYIRCDCYFDNLVVLLLLICVFVLFWKVRISRHAEICALLLMKYKFIIGKKVYCSCIYALELTLFTFCFLN